MLRALSALSASFPRCKLPRSTSLPLTSGVTERRARHDGSRYDDWDSLTGLHGAAQPTRIFNISARLVNEPLSAKQYIVLLYRLYLLAPSGDVNCSDSIYSQPVTRTESSLT